ncbi:MFS general substrate transporter [Auricularia subglabra TFB-10046 SS5]|nr:MFS general substrate transporter [Auricularia subglabra TFB-10046 SS5]
MDAEKQGPATKLDDSNELDAKRDERGVADERDSATVDVEHNFPEGGRHAWMSVVGAWLELFVSFGLVNSFGVLEDYFARIYLSNTSLTAIGWVASVHSFLVYSMGLLVGIPFDRGYFYHIMLFGATMYTFALFMLSLAQPQQFYQVFLSFGVASGIGLGCIVLPSTSVIGQYFHTRRPLVTGIVFTGASVGGIVVPIMMNHLLHGSTGYGTSMRIVAAMLGVLAFSGIALMRPHVSRKAAIAKAGVAGGRGSPVKAMVAYAREPEYVAVVVGLFCMALTVVYPLFYLQLDATQHRVRDSIAFNTLTILNAAAIPGRLVPNFLSQRFGILNTMIFNAIACAAIIFAMLGIEDSSPAPFVIIAIIYGFFSGAILSQMTPVLASQARDVHEIGTRTGVGFFFNGIAMLIGSPIMGHLLTKRYYWWKATVFSAVVMLVSAASLAFARSLKVKRTGSHLV